MGKANEDGNSDILANKKKQGKERDSWDKARIILQPVGGLVAALAIALTGFIGSSYLTKMQERESLNRLHFELLNNREQAEVDLRKEMFNLIIQSFIAPGKSPLEKEILDLELLSYNFHESINLKPLFKYLRRRIQDADTLSSQTKSGLQSRLIGAAKEITYKQMAILARKEVGIAITQNIELLDYQPYSGSMVDTSLVLKDIERKFQLHVYLVDPVNRELDVKLQIWQSKSSIIVDSSNVVKGQFGVGFFDFPMIDNVRLTEDQRFAIVLNELGPSRANITLVYFPASYASLKDKPYYEEVRKRFLSESEK
jgi:hypothetical protein